MDVGCRAPEIPGTLTSHDAVDAAARTERVLVPMPASLDGWLDMFRDLHAHPELSMQETRTARVLATSLRASGLEVTEGVGGTGVVGVLHNGPGPVVMLRGDMDGLPVREQTGLPYASTALATLSSGETVPVMHACGHDMHTTCLAATADLLACSRECWSGTLLVVGQPGEETAEGARAMLDDGLFIRFPKPDVALGQHVVPMPVYTVAHAGGPILAGTASVEITINGRGGHGSSPAACADPVTTCAYLITRLQSIVSRETYTSDPVVLTVGMVRAGTKSNIIPDEAVLALNIRARTAAGMERVLNAVRRLAVAECAATGCPEPPDIRVYDEAPPTVNDAAVSAAVAATHAELLGAAAIRSLSPLMGSEDFSEYGVVAGRYPGAPVPYGYWTWGGSEAPPPTEPVPEGELLVPGVAANHTGTFQLAAEPTLRTGVRLLVGAALTYL